MIILSLSTAEQCCSLAVVNRDTLICEESWNSNLTHSKRLLQMIEHSLEQRAGIDLSDIDVFVAAKGPGSFTGLRIGISVVLALACSTGRPALGVSSLDGIAYRFAWSENPVCVMMDARRNEVYSAVYRFEKGVLVSKGAETVVDPEQAMISAGYDALFVGSGSKAYRSLIESKSVNSSISSGLLDSVSASGMIHSLTGQPDFLTNPGNILVPSYIRKSDAELQFVGKQG